MKTRFFAYMLLLFSIASTSCMKDEEDEDYEAVYSGITLFTYATNTNKMALDGVSIAMRLGMLFNEIEEYNAEIAADEDSSVIPIVIGGKSDTEPYWDGMDTIYYEYTDEDLTPKDLLLGGSTDLSFYRDGDLYYMAYGRTNSSGDVYHTQADVDNIYRKGTYIINTNGVEKIEETSADKPWYIIPENKVIYFSTGLDKTSEGVCTYTQSTKVYYGVVDEESGKHGFFYEIENISPDTTSTGYDPAAWNMSGSVNIVEYEVSDDTPFNIESTLSKRFELDILAWGVPMCVPSMTFETIVPIEYRPETTGFGMYNSEIAIVLDAATSKYTATDVYVELRNDGGMTVSYNGSTWTEDVDDE